MTPEELEAIRDRAAARSATFARADRVFLLAELDRLTTALGKLADEYDEIGQYRIPSYEEGCAIASELRELIKGEPS